MPIIKPSEALKIAFNNLMIETPDSHLMSNYSTENWGQDENENYVFSISYDVKDEATGAITKGYTDFKILTDGMLGYMKPRETK